MSCSDVLPLSITGIGELQLVHRRGRSGVQALVLEYFPFGASLGNPGAHALPVGNVIGPATSRTGPNPPDDNANPENISEQEEHFTSYCNPVVLTPGFSVASKEDLLASPFDDPWSGSIHLSAAAHRQHFEAPLMTTFVLWSGWLS